MVTSDTYATRRSSGRAGVAYLVAYGVPESPRVGIPGCVWCPRIPSFHASRETLLVLLPLGGALAFLEDDLEGLLLAQVDEVVRSGLGFGHLGQVRQQRLHPGERDAREVVLRRFAGLLLRGIQLQEPRERLRSAAGRDLHRQAAEGGAVELASQEHVVLRHGAARDLAHRALEPDARHVVLPAAVRATRHLDGQGFRQRSHLGVLLEMAR